MSAPGKAPALRARVGVFGGTFNPVHLGHLRAAEEVTEALELEQMLFVPSAAPPHKEGDERDPIAPVESRLAWLEEAVHGNPRFRVDPLETERPGPSYSVETLRILGERLAPELPVFVIGHDAFALMDTWREPGAIFGLAHLAVMTRPPVSRGRLSEWLPRSVRDAIEVAPDGLSGRHRSADTRVWLIEISALDISSSDIRARLREGRSVRYLLPEAVHDAVVASGAYAERRAG